MKRLAKLRWLSVVLLVAFIVITVTSVVSTFYPALLATQVAPVQAMQTEE